MPPPPLFPLLQVPPLLAMIGRVVGQLRTHACAIRECAQSAPPHVQGDDTRHRRRQKKEE